MPFDILGYQQKYKDQYGDVPLEAVAKDAFTRGGYDKEYPDYDTWKKAKGIDSVVQEDTQNRRPFTEKLRDAVAHIAPAGFEDIPTAFVHGATFGYAPAAKTPEDAGMVHKIATGAAGLAGMGVGLIPAAAMLPEGATVAGAAATSGVLGGIYGAIRKPEEGEDRLSNAWKDALMFGTFGAGGKVISKGLGALMPESVGKVLEKINTNAKLPVAERVALTPAEQTIQSRLGYVTSAALGGGAGATEPAEDWQQRIQNIVTGAGTFAGAHGISSAFNAIKGAKSTPEVEDFIKKMQVGSFANDAIDEGLRTGKVNEKPFTHYNALEMIKTLKDNGIYDDGDIDRFKEKYPALRDGLNGVIAGDMKAKVNQVIQPRSDIESELKKDMASGKKIIPAKNMEMDVPEFEAPGDDLNAPEGKGAAENTTGNKEISELQTSIAKQAHYLDKNAGYKGTDIYKTWEDAFEKDKARLAELTGATEPIKPAEDLQTDATLPIETANVSTPSPIIEPAPSSQAAAGTQAVTGIADNTTAVQPGVDTVTVPPVNAAPAPEGNWLGLKKDARLLYLYNKGKYTQKEALRQAAWVNHAIDTGQYNDLLHPQNKEARRLFEYKTGKSLSLHNTGTKDMFSGTPFERQDLATRLAAHAAETEEETKLSDIQTYALGDMHSRLMTGEAGGFKGSDSATGEDIYLKSGYPRWFSDMVKQFGGKNSPTGQKESISAKGIAYIINKGMAGKQMTRRQSVIWDHIKSVADREITSGDYRQTAAELERMAYEEQIRNLEEEGIDAGAISESENDLKTTAIEEIATEKDITEDELDFISDEADKFFEEIASTAEPKPAETKLTPEEVKAKQTDIPGASERDTFSLINPETEISKPLSEQVTPKNEDLFAAKKEPVSDAAKLWKGNLNGLEIDLWQSGSARWENKELRIEFELNAPEISANPGPYWEAGIRHKGWAQESKKFKTRAEAQKWLENYDLSKINKDSWGPGEQFINEMFGKGSYEKVKERITPDNEAVVKEAIADAKKNGPSSEFRSLFGGIDPEKAGTTNEAVSALAKKLGLKWESTTKAPAISHDKGIYAIDADKLNPIENNLADRPGGETVTRPPETAAAAPATLDKHQYRMGTKSATELIADKGIEKATEYYKSKKEFIDNSSSDKVKSYWKAYADVINKTTEAKDSTNHVTGFIADLNPLQKGKVLSALSAKRNHADYGKVTSREMIEKMSAEGRVPVVKESIDEKTVSDAKQERSRIFDNGNQNIKAARLKELEEIIANPPKKISYRMTAEDGSFYDMNKTEYNYAKYLESTKERPTAPETKKEPWEMTRDEYSSKTYEGKPTGPEWTEHRKQTHKREVNMALQSGKTVPPEALKDYPELLENESVNTGEKASTTADSGEELTYNKRNRIKNGIKWEDIADKNTALKIKEATKQNVYPKPDYQKMIDDGTDPLIAHIAKQVYDSIPVKPMTRNTATDDDMKLYISAVNRVMDGVKSWTNNKEAIAAWAGKQAKIAGANLGRPTSITDMAESNKTLLDMVYPEGWKNYRAEVMLLGGNKLLSALQPGYQQGKKAMAEVKAGWPVKQESWQRQGYSINGKEAAEITNGYQHEKDGTKTDLFFVRIKDSYSSHGKGYLTKDEAQQTIDKMKPVLLLDKYKRIVGQYDTKEEAAEAAREKVKRENKPTINEKGISVEAADRTGPARRLEGEDISSDKLRETFGFKGVNFGNWMKGDTNEAERQLHLNHAYDSFMDLAEILNVTPEAMSLNGMLGIAVGAQGTGKFAAHFVPGVNEINLTRTSGAGSLAHEFGHAVDHYFARQAGLEGRGEPYLTEHVGHGIGEDGYTKRNGQKVKAFEEGIRPEITALFNSIVKSMNKKTIDVSPEEVAKEIADRKQKAQNNIDGWLKNIRRDFTGHETEFDKLADRIKNLDLGDGKISAGPVHSFSPVVAEIRDLYKKIKGRIYPLDSIKGLQANVDHYAYLNSENYGEKHIPTSREVTTDYAKEAGKLDKDKSGKPYWNTNVEKFARAFDAYVSDTLEAKAAKNTYLSHGRNDETVPKGTERETIDKAFGNLIEEIKTKETDKGTALYSVEKATSDPLPTLDDVKSVFKGQEVTQLEDGSIAIKTQGGYDLIVKSVDRIDPDHAVLQIGHGREFLKDGEMIAGKYQDGAIELVKGVGDKWTLHHESVHFMEDMGILNENEVGLLQRHIRNLVNDGKFETKNEKDIGGAEDRANFLADALTKEPKGLLGRITSKIQDFVDKIVNAFGIRTVKGITRDISSGKINNQVDNRGTGVYNNMKGETVYGSQVSDTTGGALRTDTGTNAGIPYQPTVVGREKVGSVSAATRKITSAQEAAEVASQYLSKYPDEHLLSLVLGKNGKLMHIYRHTVGLRGQSQASPSAIIGEALNTPGATTIIVAHNHPSQYTKFSDEDNVFYRDLKNMAEGSGLDVQDSIIVTATKYSSYEEGENTKVIGTGEGKIKIPLIGRVFESIHNGEKISGPDQALESAQRHIPGGGTLLLDGNNAIAGKIDLSDYRKIRGESQKELLQELEKRNARRMIVYSPAREIEPSEAHNIKMFINATSGEINLLDIIDSRGSMENRGMMPVERGTSFYSVSKTIDEYKDKLDKTTDKVATIKNAKEGLELAYDGLKRAFYPAARTENANKAAETIISQMGKNFHQEALLKGKLNEVSKHYSESTSVAAKALDMMQTSTGVLADATFNKMPKEKQYDFIARIQNGKRQETPELQGIADTVSKMFDDLYKDAESVTPGAVGYRKGYFPGMWEDEGAAERFFNDRAKNMEGSKAFTKNKVYDDIQEGIAAGLKPKGTPLDMAFAKMHEVQKYVTTHRVMQEMEADKTAVLIKASEPAPSGYTLIPEPYGIVTKRAKVNLAGQQTNLSNELQGKPEMETFRYAVKDDVAQVINNYLSRSLYENKYVGSAYAGYMNAANTLNQFQLGVGSAFHAGFTSMEAVISKFALGVKAMARGDVADAVKLMAESPLQVYKNPMLGDKLIRAYQGESVSGKEIPQIVKWLEMAGARAHMDNRFRTTTTDKMIKNWSEGSKVAAIARSPFALVEQMARPILEWLVPRQKFGVFAELATEWNKQNPGATHEDTRTAMQYIWNRVDSRLGQVVYERLFTNNVAKNVVQALLRAPGWTGGTIVEVGGGVNDFANVFRDMAHGKKPVMTDKMAYTISLLTITGLINGVMTKLLTGEDPKDGKDLLAFRTGKIDEHGNPERMMLPTYAKDIYAYINKPGTTLLNKTHPMISLMADIAKNKDYYGTQIRDKESNPAVQTAQAGVYAAKAFVPFWMRGAQKASDRGDSAASMLSPLIGIMPATAEFTKTKAQKLMSEILQDRPKGSMTKEKADTNQLKQKLETRLRNHDNTANTDVQEYFKAGKLSRNDVISIQKAVRIPYMVHAFQSLSFPEAMRVYSVATPDEKKTLAPLLRQKMHLISNMPPENRQDALLKYREVMGG